MPPENIAFLHDIILNWERKKLYFQPRLAQAPNIMFLLCMPPQVALIDKYFIALVALVQLSDIETQIVGCQLARAARWTTKHNWLPRFPPPANPTLVFNKSANPKSHQEKYLCQEKNTIACQDLRHHHSSTNQNHRENVLLYREIICFQQIENPRG